MDSAASTRSGQVSVSGNAVAPVGPEGRQDARLDARHRYKLLGDCRELVLGRLSALVGRALEQINRSLADEALALERGDRKRSLLDTVLLLRQHRRAIEQNFRRVFGNLFERRLFSQPGATAAAETHLPEIVRLAGRVRSNLDPAEGRAVRAGLGALLERDPFDENRDPVAPELIFEALQAGVVDASTQAVDRQVWEALAAAFEPHLSRDLGGIYRELSARLGTSSAPSRPVPRAAAAAATARTDPERRVPGAVQASGADDRGEPAPRGPAASAVAARTAAGVVGLATLPAGEAIAATAASAVPAIPPGLSIPSVSSVSSVSSVTSASSVSSVSSVLSDSSARSLASAPATAGEGGSRPLDALQATLNGIDQQGLHGEAVRLLSDPGMFGVADLPVEPVQPALLNSLAGCQPERDDDWLPSRLTPRLVEQARDGGTPLDRMTVELVGAVFGFIEADPTLARTVKQHLMRLQVVAVKAALLDRSFFARRQHPMREVIDRTTQLAADPDVDLASDGPLLVGLAEVVDRLMAGVGQDLSSFVPAIARLDQLRQEEAQRRAESLASQLARAEHEEASALVIDRARSDIIERIDESVPAFVREFLLRWWTLAIGRKRMAQATVALATEDATLRVAEQLIWSVAPKHPEEIGRLAGLLPRLITSLVEGARSVEMPDAAREAFLQELLTAHGGVIDQAKRWQVGQPDPRSTTMRLRSDGSVRFNRPPRDSVTDPVTVAAGESVLGQFERGDHIELSNDTGEPAIYKLAWISPARKLFILSRYPKDTLSLSAAQLASLVFNERARLLDGPQAVDDAIGVLAREAGDRPRPSHGLPG